MCVNMPTTNPAHKGNSIGCFWLKPPTCTHMPVPIRPPKSAGGWHTPQLPPGPGPGTAPETSVPLNSESAAGAPEMLFGVAPTASAPAPGNCRCSVGMRALHMCSPKWWTMADRHLCLCSMKRPTESQGVTVWIPSGGGEEGATDASCNVYPLQLATQLVIG